MSLIKDINGDVSSKRISMLAEKFTGIVLIFLNAFDVTQVDWAVPFGLLGLGSLTTFSTLAEKEKPSKVIEAESKKDVEFQNEFK